MKALPKILLALTALAVVVLSVTVVQAVPITYQYTGNPFTDVVGPYTTSDSVTGMITLAGPFAANMPLTPVTPISFTFSDGVQTITDMTAIFSDFTFATGSTGEITAWFIELQILNGFSTARIHTESFFNGASFDQGELPGHMGFGDNRFSPGVWAVTGAPVPDAGSTLSLMTLTLMALGVAARQFKRAAA